MAELALIFAEAAYGLAWMGNRSPEVIERVQAMNDAVIELQQRVVKLKRC